MTELPPLLRQWVRASADGSANVLADGRVRVRRGTTAILFRDVVAAVAAVTASKASMKTDQGMHQPRLPGAPRPL